MNAFKIKSKTLADYIVLNNTYNIMGHSNFISFKVLLITITTRFRSTYLFFILHIMLMIYTVAKIINIFFFTYTATGSCFVDTNV